MPSGCVRSRQPGAAASATACGLAGPRRVATGARACARRRATRHLCERRSVRPSVDGGTARGRARARCDGAPVLGLLGTQAAAVSVETIALAIAWRRGDAPVARGHRPDALPNDDQAACTLFRVTERAKNVRARWVVDAGRRRLAQGLYDSHDRAHCSCARQADAVWRGSFVVSGSASARARALARTDTEIGVGAGVESRRTVVRGAWTVSNTDMCAYAAHLRTRGVRGGVVVEPSKLYNCKVRGRGCTTAKNGYDAPDSLHTYDCMDSKLQPACVGTLPPSARDTAPRYGQVGGHP